MRPPADLAVCLMENEECERTQLRCTGEVSTFQLVDVRCSLRIYVYGYREKIIVQKHGATIFSLGSSREYHLLAQ
jgi:hypothetical protein